MSYVPRTSWKRLYSVDFTALATQNLSPNGAYTLGGITWNSENNANANSFQLTSGTGIAIDVKAGAANYGDNVRTAPLLWAKLKDFYSTVTFGQWKAIRLMFRVTLANADTNYEFAKAGIERATTPNQFHAMVGRGYNTGNIIVEGQLSTSATTTRASVTSSDDLIGLIWKPHFNFDYFSAPWSGAFPRATNYVAALSSTLGANYLRDADDSSGASVHPRVVLSAQPTGSANTFVATYTHMAIDELVG